MKKIKSNIFVIFIMSILFISAPAFADKPPVEINQLIDNAQVVDVDKIEVENSSTVNQNSLKPDIKKTTYGDSFWKTLRNIGLWVIGIIIGLFTLGWFLRAKNQDIYNEPFVDETVDNKARSLDEALEGFIKRNL